MPRELVGIAGEPLGLKEWVIPQDQKFFDLLDRITANGVAAADALKELLEAEPPTAAHRKRVKDLEHATDDLVHEMYGALNRSFITPIDHADFASLVTGLDDFVDFIDATANRVMLYEIASTTDGMRAMGALIQRQAAELQRAVGGLRRAKRPEDTNRACIEVHSLENAADAILNEALASLFQGTDAVHILKHKEIYEYLEIATDKAEDAANIIGDIVMKNA